METLKKLRLKKQLRTGRWMLVGGIVGLVAFFIGLRFIPETIFGCLVFLLFLVLFFFSVCCLAFGLVKTMAASTDLSIMARKDEEAEEEALDRQKRGLEPKKT